MTDRTKTYTLPRETALSRGSAPAATGKKTWGHVYPPLALLLAILVVWQVTVTVGSIPPSLLPSPLRVLSAGWGDKDDLAAAAWISIQETIVGLGLGIVVAVVVAILVDSFTPFRRAVYPLLVGSQTVPVVAIAPLVVLWFGFGIVPKILLVALYTFFPIAVGMISGIAQTPEESVDLMRTIGVSRWRVLLPVKLPHAAPHFFSGLRIASSFALGTAVIAEFLGSFNGLGIYLIAAKASFRIDLVFAASALIVALTLILFALVVVVERLALPWRRFDRRAS